MKDLPVGLTQGMPKLADNTLTVLEKRYLDKDENGALKETPDQMFWRVATTLAKDEQSAQEYFSLMRSLEFLPNSPTIANAGTRTGQLSACFVLPVEDDLGGIFETIKHAALIHQTGGGTGFAFSRLRAKNDFVASTRGKSSGPMSFMDVFNVATDSIKQGGMRRGANMGILRVDHPDIMEFIGYKDDLTKLTNFNVSVGVTDVFLKAVEEGTEYDLINPRTKEVVGQLDAKKVWSEIIKRAWNSGEPGVVFIDRMNAHNPNPGLGDYEATNPCGEQPLVPYESCNLGSINLVKFVKHNIQTGKMEIDWAALREAIEVSTRLLDDVVDANKYVPTVPKIKEVTLATRKIGLGVMGQARMLFKLGIPYNSEEGRQVSQEVYAFIDLVSKETSMDLADKNGAFPYMVENWDEVVAFYKKDLTQRAAYAQAAGFQDIAAGYLKLVEDVGTYGFRNSTTTTVAPTGTLSVIADTSGGCEPEFALFISRFQADVEMIELNPVLVEELRSRGFAQSKIDLIAQALKDNHGSLVEVMSGVPLDPRVFSDADLDTLYELAQVYVVAGDISPTAHVLMQAALQQFCDSAISKTINFPREATVEQVEEAYNLAVKSGCKGITIYRDGSRQFQPLTAGDKGKKEAPKLDLATPEEEAAVFGDEAGDTAKSLNDFDLYSARVAGRIEARQPRKRPEDLYGFTRRIETGDGKLYVTANYDEEGLREVVLNVGKSGGVLNALVESLGRVISIALQHHTPVADIAKQLVGVRGGVPFGFGPKSVLSIPDAVGKMLNSVPKNLLDVLAPVEEIQPMVAPAPAPVIEKTMNAETRQVMIDHGHSPDCPECGGSLAMAEGCVTCMSCGFSRCA